MVPVIFSYYSGNYVLNLLIFSEDSKCCQRGIMKDVLSGYVAMLARWMLVCTALLIVFFCYQGTLQLIGALFIGYLGAAICIWTLVYRTWKSAGLDPASAKKQMLWGFALRLFTCFTILAVAAQISRAVFAATATGFLLFYAVAMAILVYYNRKNILQDENKKG